MESVTMPTNQNVDSQSNTPIQGTTVSGVRYTISGGDSQTVTFHMNDGDQIVSEPGAMNGKSPEVSMNASFRGNPNASFGRMLLSGAKRMVSGESLMMMEYTSRGDGRELNIPVKFPGELIPIDLHEGQTLIMQRGAYVCGDDGMEPDLHVERNLGTGLLGGEGFLLQKVKGPGTIFLSTGGNGIMRELKAGERYTVGTGYLAAWEDDVGVSTEWNKAGVALLGGEGFANTVVEGPGKVWIQSMPPHKMAEVMRPYMMQPGRNDAILDASGIAGETLSGVAGSLISGMLRN